MITINSLSKAYNNKLVLNNINLSFKRGEINGIVGENGAGKTSLFKCICGLEHFEGKIVYDDGILKEKLGFLPTTNFFFSHMTGYEYLQLLCNARKIKLKQSEQVNIFNLPLNQYVETYSTGMKKKLGLTGLLIQKNDVFILDEPFNGVDIHSNIIIQEILCKLKELNKIVIMSSHIFSTLKLSCDYLHLLKNGNIVESANKNHFDKIENEMEGKIRFDIGNKIIEMFD